MLRAVMTDDARECVGGLKGFARLPEELQRVQANDLDAALGQLVRDGNVEPSPAAVAARCGREIPVQCWCGRGVVFLCCFFIYRTDSTSSAAGSLLAGVAQLF